MPVSGSSVRATGINIISGGGEGGGGFWSSAAAPPSHVAVAFTAVAGVACVAALLYSTTRGGLRPPWSLGRRKPLSPQQWRNFFTPEGKLHDGGIILLKKVRSGGVHPSIRAEVWPFLLGVYDLNSTKEERDIVRTQKRKEYEKLRRRCKEFLRLLDESFNGNGENGDSESVVSVQESVSSQKMCSDAEYSDDPSSALVEGEDRSDAPKLHDGISDSESSEEPEVIQSSSSSEMDCEIEDVQSKLDMPEDYVSWQRTIRLDAVRANAEWIPYASSQATVTNDQALLFAEAVGLKDYDHLEPCRIFHAARMVAILEAYAVYDPEIGYCQGMSDLLSPIIAIITEDYQAFWCFVGFMKKARHNFRLDEAGIRRQLNIVSKIIKSKDRNLYRHLEKIEAADCFFVYRMVVVLFRRELTFEQTLCLWEVMWADQTAIRAGIGELARSRIRLRAPPTEDLLLYAIAASVLQRRKLIIEKYSSMDEILKECNDMAGKLDVWKLLDDAHNLVASVHDKIETSP